MLICAYFPIQINEPDPQRVTRGFQTPIAQKASERNQNAEVQCLYGMMQYQEVKLWNEKNVTGIWACTLGNLGFLPRSRPPSILINLFGVDILLIWEPTGEGTDSALGGRLSKELSCDCRISFGFFELGSPGNPL